MLGVVLAGCQTLDTGLPRERTMALAGGSLTGVHALFPAADRAPPGESALRLLPDGVGAFVARAYLARRAGRSLDLQYYMINADDTGQLLAGELLAAADRGVRVRILVDDIYAPDHDRAIAIFDSHPHIEVRLFNPWTRRRGVLARVFGFLLDPGRLNHRMHNKLFIADGHAVILGGRNIGDEYFDLRARMNFRDLDVLAVGPAAAQAAASFDDYWNSDWAVPAAGLTDHTPAADSLDEVRALLAAHRQALRDSPWARALESSEMARELASGTTALEFGAARVLADPPSKVAPSARDRSRFLIERLRREAGGAAHELQISSPYFVPRDGGVAALTGLAAGGVAVSVLTNSLAANDVRVVHGGYARYRAALLRGGVRLYELRPTSPISTRQRERRRFGSEYVSLHAKYFVIDRRTLFVGSINLDPRSIDKNTEAGLLIECEPLARQAAALFDLAGTGSISYEVTLRDGRQGRSDALAWTGMNPEGEVRYDREPESTWWQRFTVWLTSLLPFVESQI